jgi:signal transduction histidine kinase
VEDNGIGFDSQQAMQKSGHGLININQRALALQAEYQWRASRFTTGSCFRLSIPVNKSSDTMNISTEHKAVAHGG